MEEYSNLGIFCLVTLRHVVLFPNETPFKTFRGNKKGELDANKVTMADSKFEVRTIEFTNFTIMHDIWFFTKLS